MHDDTSGDGSEVRFPSGDATIRGELYAATARVAPALVLIPDVHGISPLYREIAAKLGYSELPNFTRAFRKWTGHTPAAFRDRDRR